MPSGSTEEKIVEVDRQGRMVLPSQLREHLGIKKGGRILIRVEGSAKLIIERRPSKSVQERVENWMDLARNTRSRILTGETNPRRQTEKWMSEEYARRKLGLRAD